LSLTLRWSQAQRTTRPAIDPDTMSTNSQDWQEAPVKVVKNHEEQYSIWPATRPNPAGWQDVGKSGTKAECLEFIRGVWTDMRPLSLRREAPGK
jgi:MbtH protein